MSLLEQELLEAAVDALASWVDAESKRFQVHWLRSNATVFDYARLCRGDLTRLLAKQLGDGRAVASVFDADHAYHCDRARAVHKAATSAKRTKEDQARANTFGARVGWQMTGLLSAVMAAHHLREWEVGSAIPDEFNKYARRALHAYNRALPVTGLEYAAGSAPGEREFDGPKSKTAVALAEILAPSEEGPWPPQGEKVLASSWLAVRRILAYALAEQESRNRFEVEVAALYAIDKAKSGGGQVGVVQPLIASAEVDGCTGCFLDPVALGLVLVDDSMLDSLRLAWRVSWPEIQRTLNDRSEQGAHLPAVRVAPDIQRSADVGSAYMLTGGSAGGIFVCAVYAAATGVPLNPQVTASVKLQSVDADSLQSIVFVHVELAGIAQRSLLAKLEAARERRLVQVALEQSQVDALRAAGALPDEPYIRGVSNLQQVFNLLRNLDPIDKRVRQIVESEMDWVVRCHSHLRLPFSDKLARLEQVYAALSVDPRSTQERIAIYNILSRGHWGRPSFDAPPDVVWDIYQDPLSRASETYVQEYGWGLLPQELLNDAPSNRSAKVHTLGEVYRDHDCVVILGDPGSGKTTLARWLALTMATRWQERFQPVRVKLGEVDPTTDTPDESFELGAWKMPIFLRAGEFAQAMIERSEKALTLFEYLGHHQWSEHRGGEDGGPCHVHPGDQFGERISPEERHSAIRRAIMQGQAVVIVDGLDEVADARLRVKVRDAVDVFIRDHVHRHNRWIGHHTGNRLVVTSRIAGYDLCSLSGAGNVFTVIVEGMEMPAVERFVRNWMRVMRSDLGDADEQTTLLLEQLGDPRRKLKRFISNPLQAGVLTAVFQQEHQLANTRVENYFLAVNKFFDRWMERQGDAAPEPRFERSRIISCLEDIALWIHENRSTGLILEDELKTQLRTSLLDGDSSSTDNAAQQDDRNANQVVDSLVSLLSNEIGMLAPRGHKQFGFLVLSIQEYLVARRMARGGLDDICRTLSAHLDDARFREPILMALGHISHTRPEDLESVIRLFLTLDDNLVDLLPRAPLLMLDGIDDLVERPGKSLQNAVLAQILDRLLKSYAAPSAVPELKEIVEKAVLRIRTIDEEAATQAIIAVLAEGGVSDSHGNSVDRIACSIGQLLTATEWYSETLATELGGRLANDAESLEWPIQTYVQRALSGFPDTSYVYNDTRHEMPGRSPIRYGRPHSVHDALRHSGDPQQMEDSHAWLCLLIGLYGGLDDLDSVDHVEEYLRYAFYLSLENDEMERYVLLHHHKWGTDDPIYDIAVYLLTRCGAFWKARRTPPAFTHSILFYNTALDEGVGAAIHQRLPLDSLRTELRHVLNNNDITPQVQHSASFALILIGDERTLQSIRRDTTPELRHDLSRSARRVRDALARASCYILSESAWENVGHLPGRLRDRFVATLQTMDPHLLLAADVNLGEHLAAAVRGIGRDASDSNELVHAAVNTHKDEHRHSLLMAMRHIGDTTASSIAFAPRKWNVAHFGSKRIMDGDVPASIFDTVLQLPLKLASTRSAFWEMLLPSVESNPKLRPEFMAAMLCDFSQDSDNSAVWSRIKADNSDGDTVREQVAKEVEELDCPYYRSRARLRLADAWGDRRSELVTEAFADACTIDRAMASERAEILERVLTRMPAEERSRALDCLQDAIQAIGDAEDRARAWIRFAFLSTHRSCAKALANALDSSLVIANEAQRADLLAQTRHLVNAFPELDANWEECMARFRDCYERAWARGERAPVITQVRDALRADSQITPTVWATLHVGSLLQDAGANPPSFDDLWHRLARDPSPESVAKLVEAGDRCGIPFSLLAAVTLDRRIAAGNEGLVTPLWPLLREPDIQTASILEDWASRRVEKKVGLFEPTAGRAGGARKTLDITDFATLLLCELHGYPIGGSMQRLAKMLNAPDAAVRCRVEKVLVPTEKGKSPTFSSVIFGTEWMQELSRLLLERDPRVQVRFCWVLERLAIDSKYKLIAMIQNQKPANKSLIEVSRYVTWASTSVQSSLADTMRDMSSDAHRRIVAGLASLSANRRLTVDVRADLFIPEHCEDAYYHEDIIRSADGPDVVAYAVIAACQEAGLGLSCDSVARRASAKYRSGVVSLATVLREGRRTSDIESALERIGHLWLFRHDTLASFRKAAGNSQALAEKPRAMEVLLAWYLDHNKSEIQESLFNHDNALRHFLLGGLAEAAFGCPNVFLQSIGNSREVRAALMRDLSSEYIGRVGRCAALCLLGALRLVTEEVARAFVNAFCDTSDVIECALHATTLFREIEPRALEVLIGSPDARSGLYSEDAVSAFAAGRILKAVGSSAWAKADDRRKILKALADGIRHPLSSRRVHLGPPLTYLPPPRRLSEEFHSSMVSVARMDTIK